MWRRAIVWTSSLLLASVAAADVINVPADHPTIQGAIEAAVNGDEIVVAAGTYNELIDLLGKAIVVRGSDGRTSTFIDGTDLQGSLVTCSSGEGRDTLIEGFTIKNGRVWAPEGGGGMKIVASSPSVVDCHFIENGSGGVDDGMGGAIHISGGDPLISNCRFEGNGAGDINGRGGAIYSSGALTVSDSQFIDNRVCGCCEACGGSGGAVYAAQVVLIDCTFEENRAVYGVGGAVRGGTVTLLRCVFSDNRATSVSFPARGGAVEAGQLTAVSCRFSGNQSTLGGAISAGSISLANCVFASNSTVPADYWPGPQLGGAIQADSCTAVCCTFRGNTAEDGAGAVDAGSIVFRNCIVWGNAPTEDQLSVDGTADVAYCNVEGGWVGAGNIDSHPLFADGHGRLSPGSPCIDAGDTTVLPADEFDLDGDGDMGEPIPLDLDENLRTVNDPSKSDTGVPGPLGAVVDIGAFEFMPPCPDPDGNGYVDVDDLLNVILDWGTDGSEHNADVDGSGVVDADDLVAVILAWGPCE